MNLKSNASTSNLQNYTQQSKRSSQSIKGQDKQKILAIILSENQNKDFRQFCLQIYNQSIYLSPRRLAHIILCSSYHEFKSLKKNDDCDYFILSSQKIIQQLHNLNKIKQNWVVFDSGQFGSKKKILDMPNVVYYTKQLQSLKTKLQSRKFISKQTLLNEKYRRNYQQNKKKVQTLLTNPIQCYIKVTAQPNQYKQMKNLQAPSIIQALKSQVTIKTLSQKIIFHSGDLKYNTKSNENANLSPNSNTNFVTYPYNKNENIVNNRNQQLQIQNDYFQENIQNSKPLRLVKQDEKKYENIHVGPGSNRIIDLASYEKFIQNGIIVYRKNTPQNYYMRPVQKKQKVNSLHRNQNKSNLVNIEYRIPQNNYFNPQNATYDHKIVFNNTQDLNKKIKKPYKTCDSDVYNNSAKINFHENQNDKIKNVNKEWQSQHLSKYSKRSSDQVKQYLDSISNYKPQDDYLMSKPKDSNNSTNTKNLSPVKQQYQPNISQQKIKQILLKKKQNSNAKLKSLSNRSPRLDIQNKNKNIYQKNKLLNKPQSVFENSQSSSTQKQNSKISKSLPSSRGWRPLIRSSQKKTRQTQIQKSPQRKPIKQMIKQVSKISQKTKQQKSTVQSYIVQIPQNIDEIMCVSRVYNLNAPPCLSEYGFSLNKQEMSVLYLVDHLMNEKILNYLQSFITSNDSIYKFKNLYQLQNQIKQSYQVYDLIFVFRQQVISEQDISQFYEINPACYFVEINSKIEDFKINLNKLIINELNSFGSVLNKIADMRIKKN